MSDFERWFLLAYTTYTVISIFALLWVGSKSAESAKMTIGPRLVSALLLTAIMGGLY